MLQISQIELCNFRNFESAVFSFKAGYNVIIGKNATGKTNILESIYCTHNKGRSFRQGYAESCRTIVASIRVRKH